MPSIDSLSTTPSSSVQEVKKQINKYQDASLHSNPLAAANEDAVKVELSTQSSNPSSSVPGANISNEEAAEASSLASSGSDEPEGSDVVPGTPPQEQAQTLSADLIA